MGEVPWGIRETLKWLKDEYNDPQILITENGISENGDSTELNDWWRKEYFYGYINEVYKAMTIDDVNVIGYTAWSLMDNFEWDQGYTERFGLHWVDFDDPERKRIPKESVACFREIIRNGFPEGGIPECQRDSPTPEPSTAPPTTETPPTCGVNLVCGPNAGCVVVANNDDICECRSGYTGDPYSLANGCTDINECMQPAVCSDPNSECSNTDGCGLNAMCMNTQGSYLCTCMDGFTGDAYEEGCTAEEPGPDVDAVPITATLTWDFTFEDSLNDPESDLYKQYSQASTDTLLQILSTTSAEVVDPFSIVWAFTEGSVVATANEVFVENVESAEEVV